MTGAPFQRRALAVFDEVCDLPAGELEDALEQRCGDDAALRARVMELLASDRDEGAPIGGAPQGQGAGVLASDLASAPDITAETPERIGRYRIIRELGRGGMGVVYEAEQENPRRRVALKVIRQGFATRQLLRRFEQEANVLGQLDHPGIAGIFEAGSAPIGNAVWPYFAMEYIEGEPIDRHAQRLGLSVRDTLELVARICDAVQHAHQKGIIHRDLKPGNILVKQERTVTDHTGSGTFIDEIGQPKILDFGVARAIDAEVRLTSIQTNVGQIVGTLSSMSPEQVLGDPEKLDTRSDVYAIGVILYRLLTGRMPLELANRTIPEATRIITEEEPRRPSSINKKIVRDIDTIVLKALEKDSDRRYGSAAELAMDLRRFLRDEPISAHPPSALYQVRKFTRRNRALVSGVAATLIALTAGLIAVSVALVEARSQRDLAEAERRRAEEVLDFQSDLLAGMDPRQFGRQLLGVLREDYEGAIDEDGSDEAARDASLAAFDGIIDRVNGTSLARRALRDAIIERAIEEIDEGVSDDPVVEAELRYAVGKMYKELGMYDEALGQFDTSLGSLLSVIGEDHNRTIAVMLRSGQMLLALGRLDEARQRLGRTLSVSGRVLGPDHRYTHSAQRELADTLRKLGEYPEAERHLRSLAASLTETLGAEDDSTLAALNTLGVTLLDMNDTDGAITIFQDVLETRTRVFGPDRPTTITARNNLMGVLFRLNRMEEAEAIAREVLESSIRVRGDDHPRTILAHNNLGRVILDLGRPAEALVEFRDAYELSLGNLAVNSEVREACAGNLVDTLLALDRPDEAEPICVALLESRRTAPSPRAGSIAQTLEQLGLCLLAQGRAVESESAFRECLEIRSGLSEDHWLTHRARSHLGSAIAAQGRFDTARPLLEESAAAIERQRESIPANMRDREVEAARRRTTGALDKGS